MTNEEILQHVDHTLLKAAASWEEIKILCDEAVRFNTASVCIPPSYVKPAHDAYGGKLLICTVVGFPLGYNSTAAKILETETAIREGAAEIDMVINIGDVKNGNFDRVFEEIKLVKKACLAGKNDKTDSSSGTDKKIILKVIVETCFLTQDEKIKLCSIVSEAGADYIKTSTGFGSTGAAAEDVMLFKKHIAPQVKIKAAGGIKTREEMESMINAGADRIGSSSAVKILGD